MLLRRSSAFFCWMVVAAFFAHAARGAASLYASLLALFARSIQDENGAVVVAGRRCKVAHAHGFRTPLPRVCFWRLKMTPGDCGAAPL